jgi:hypothetical protein
MSIKCRIWVLYAFFICTTLTYLCTLPVAWKWSMLKELVFVSIATYAIMELLTIIILIFCRPSQIIEKSDKEKTIKFRVWALYTFFLCMTARQICEVPLAAGWHNFKELFHISLIIAGFMKVLAAIILVFCRPSQIIGRKE